MIPGVLAMETLMLALYTKILLALYSLKLTKDESGVTAIEYGLIATLVAVICITAWSLLGSKLSTQFSNIANSV
jgi:pilus assembly protein Flp/PilA